MRRMNGDEAGERKHGLSRRERLVLEAVGFALILSASTFLVVKNAFLTYDFFDMSAFMDAGYRVFIGQVPYVDFYYIAGPLHLYLHALSYHLLGFNRWAVLAQVILVNSVVLVALQLLARRHLATAEGLLVTAVSGVCFYGFMAHPWYDQNAHAWLVLGLAALELLPAPDRRGGWMAPVLAGAAVAFAFFTKANIGLAAGALFAAMLVVSSRPVWSLALAAIGGVVGTTLVLGTLADPMALIENNFFGYNAAKRLQDILLFLRIFTELPYTYMAAVLVLLGAAGGREFVRAERRLFAACAGLLFASFWAVLSGSLRIYSNVPLVGLDLLYLLAVCRRLAAFPVPVSRRPVVVTGRVLVFVLAYLALFSYITRAGQYPTAWMWRYSNLESNYALQNDPLKGWLTSRRIGPGVDGAVAYIQSHVPRDESLFVFPNCTVIYGLTGRDSYRGAPFIFHIGYAPGGYQYDAFRERFLGEPPDWILLDLQREVEWAFAAEMLEWLALDDFVKERYEPVADFGELRLLRMRPTSTSGERTPGGAASPRDSDFVAAERAGDR